jgi:hypothetical protein
MPETHVRAVLAFIRFLLTPRRHEPPARGTVHCHCGALVDRTDDALGEHIEVCPVQVAARAASAAHYAASAEGRLDEIRAVLADSSLTDLAAIDAIGYIAHREHAGSAL